MKPSVHIVVELEGQPWLVLLAKTVEESERFLEWVVEDDEARDTIRRFLKAGAKWAGRVSVPDGSLTLHDIYAGDYGGEWLERISHIHEKADPRDDPWLEARSAARAYLHALQLQD